jgi:osmoprotectant transport system substrate-binding protein
LKRLLILLGLCVLIAALLPTGCGRPKIRVGSGTAPERLLMAQMIITVLDENGFEVIDMTPTGSKTATYKALKSGIIDICPGYTGNREDLEKNTRDETGRAVWLKPAPADNKWAIAVTEDFATKYNVRNMTQFKDYINGGGNFKMMCSQEFTQDSNALMLFENKYGFKLNKAEQLIITPDTNTLYGGMEAANKKDIDGAMAYTTDGYLEELGLIILEDDGEYQPVFNPAPVVNEKLYKEYAEELNRILTPLFASLDDKVLQELNSQIGLVGREVTSEIARKYVQQNCCFDYCELQLVQNAVREMMKERKLGSIEQTGDTSDMSSFPNNDYPLYYETEYFKTKGFKPEDFRPDMSTKDMTWPYITWRTTKGTYTCKEDGTVTQVSTGW